MRSERLNQRFPHTIQAQAMLVNYTRTSKETTLEVGKEQNKWDGTQEKVENFII